MSARHYYGQSSRRIHHGFSGTFKVSRIFSIVPESEDCVYVVGTPSDIRKVIADLEKSGYYNLFEKYPIMREGRRYNICFDPSYNGDLCYSVGRVSGNILW